jgi:hypothetical protein
MTIRTLARWCAGFMSTELVPLRTRTRTHDVDALRGFALLGIPDRQHHLRRLGLSHPRHQGPGVLVQPRPPCTGSVPPSWT